MMSNKITGKEFPLMKIFSPDFDYHIPTYQRPYAWTEEQTETLFDDLLDFYKTEKIDNYFLGSIVLKKEEEIPYSDVIDGQQRLTTLTILLSAIASHLTGEARITCNTYLREPGNALVGLQAKPRLHLRGKDKDFFEKYIQDVKMKELLALDAESLLNESQQHIRANCKVFLDRIKSNFNDDESLIRPFCTFVLTRCYLVTVYTPSQQSAFRVFSVMNSRGLDLQTTDIVKADIIGNIPETEQQAYTDKWEDLEVQTTRAGFNDVFTHTRMIFAKVKAKKNLLDEFREYVLSKVDSKALIDTILEPYADAYTVLKNKKYVAAQKSEKVNEYLFWLNKIDNSDWMPSAMKFMAGHSNEPEYVLWFIKKLERLSSYLHITAQDINHRIDRYKSLLEEMDTKPNHSISDKLVTVELSDVEKNEFMNALGSEIYKMTARRRNYLILRLDSFVTCVGKKSDYDPTILTIEHVLPQTVSSGSQWEQIWTDKTVQEYWLNRIANLVPLTRRQNSEAQNYDFDKKKNTYFKGKNGTTSYPLTTQVIGVASWTPAVVEMRQKGLLEVFKKEWDL